VLPVTVRGRIVKRNEKIRRMLLKCYPMSTIAKFTKISVTRVRQIRDDFIATGQLMAVPHTKPILYIDPHAHALGTEFADKDGGAENNGAVRDSLPASGRLPLGMTNAHISGRISMTVRKKGDFSDIKGPDNLYVGYWDKAGSGGKGKTHRKAHLRLFKQELTINFYESTKGTMEFYVNPGRVYYYPSKMHDHEVIDYILERVLFVASLLKTNGWEVTEPQLPKHYQLHRGKEGDPLATLIPPRYHHEDQDIISDTSPDYLETEIENPSDEELVEIYANMPSKIRQNILEIRIMKVELEGLREVAKIQTDVIQELVGNVSKLAEGMARLTNAEASVLNHRFTEFTGEGYQ